MIHNVPQNKESLDAQLAEVGLNLPYRDDVSPLAAPCKIGNREAANRIVYQAMEGCDGTAEGAPDELTVRRYLRFAEGGPGIIWFEATALLPEARANPRQLYLTDKTKDAFARLVNEIKEKAVQTGHKEPLIFVQLTHSGRYSKPTGTPAPMIAYNNPIFEKDTPIDPSRIVTDDYLDRLGEVLAEGAKTAEAIGFDGADIKSCHRYLLSELLSAYERPGKYGGSFENRTRLLRETVTAVAQNRKSKDFIVTSRLNVYDGFPYPYGFGVKEGCGIDVDLTEAKRLVSDLVAGGIDLIDCTMGNPYFNPHVNRPYARGGYEPPEAPIEGVVRMLTGIREVASAIPGTPVISSGISYLGTEAPHVLAGCVGDGWFDFAGFGRETLAYPSVADRIVKGEGLDPKKICVCCGKCTEIMRKPGGTPGCVVRDTDVYTPLYKKFVLGK